MPKAFENCVKSGGRVRTIKGPNKKFGLKKGQYMHICFKGGKMYRGHKKVALSEALRGAKSPK